MRYTSDLIDAQWEEIKEYFPAGNKSKYDKREPVNAVLYPVKKGIGEHLKTPMMFIIRALAAFQKTMRSKLFTLKLCVLFPIFIRCCVGSDSMWTGSYILVGVCVKVYYTTSKQYSHKYPKIHSVLWKQCLRTVGNYPKDQWQR